MLDRGYNPANYGGKIWWNENDPKMRAIWGTQEDYDRYISEGGTWKEYEIAAKLRMVALKEIKEQQSVVINDDYSRGR